MTLLIIASILYVASTWIGFYAYKRNVQATEKMKEIEYKEDIMRAQRRFMNVPMVYCSKIDLNNSRVKVGGRWMINGDMVDVCFKEFPYKEDDLEDMNFAIREAEELMEKLNATTD